MFVKIAVVRVHAYGLLYFIKRETEKQRQISATLFVLLLTILSLAEHLLVSLGPKPVSTRQLRSA